ncbi:MAG: nitroreductase family protein [Bacillota bacterium]
MSLQLAEELKTGAEEQVNWTEVEKVIFKRRSVRLYKKQQVPEELVKRILEAGRFAPSAGNAQDWKFVVIRDQDIINDITRDVVKKCKFFRALLEYRGSKIRFFKKIFSKMVTRFIPNDLHPTPFGAVMLIAQEKLGLYHGAPTVILILKDVRGVSNPVLDAGIAGQNMVLAAHSLGLGTCWVSFSKLALETRYWRKRLGIEYPYEFVSSLAVGYPVGDPDGFVKRDMHEVDWFEGGTKKTLYKSNVPKQSWLEKQRIPSYDVPAETKTGRMKINDNCNGCGLCVKVCPAKTLEVRDGKSRMADNSECMFCGDCYAACPKGAIEMLEPMRLTGFYKSIGLSDPKPPGIY